MDVMWIWWYTWTQASVEYNGDFSRLLDLARASISFATVSGLTAGLEAIYTDSTVQVGG
jgi:hypothetical protein